MALTRRAASSTSACLKQSRYTSELGVRIGRRSCSWKSRADDAVIGLPAGPSRQITLLPTLAARRKQALSPPARREFVRDMRFLAWGTRVVGRVGSRIAWV